MPPLSLTKPDMVRGDLPEAEDGAARLIAGGRRKTDMQFRKLAVAAGAAIVVAASAQAALMTEHIGSDAELNGLLDEVSFVAEGRIGDLGGNATFELDLGQDTGAPADQANLPWVNGQMYAFSIFYDQGTNTVEYSLSGETLVYQPAGAFTDIFVRTRAVHESTSVSVTDLMLDGMAIGDSSIAIGAGLDILRISGADLMDGFTLTGNAMLSWTGQAPSQSQLAYQIKFGTVIPGPGAMAVFAGFAVVGLGRRRQG
jgi:hypothetical protein